MTNEVTRLPVPEHLEPKSANRSLLHRVRGYFYALYNSTDNTGADFREYLSSVGNKDAVTANYHFDRWHAVNMIKIAAKRANDTATTEAKDGIIYKHLVNVMRPHVELRLKQRRIQYKRQEHQQQAAE
jgi:hypothetical protein